MCRHKVIPAQRIRLWAARLGALLALLATAPEASAFPIVAQPGDTLAGIAQRICNPQSATFHTGPASDWTRLFTERHRQLFIETGGEALVERLGYAPTLAAQPVPA